MLIWLKTALGELGVEHGVVHAHELEEVLNLARAREDIERRTGEMLAAARSQAEAILAEAHAQAQQLRDAAVAQIEAARNQGYEAGLRKAVLEWHERQAGHAVQKAQALRSVHDKLAEIVTTAVERIVHIEQRGALYQRALNSVQTLTRGASSLTLRVSPADHEDACSAIASVEGLQHAGLQVEVKADPSLRPGSCIFESDIGVVDASLQTQLDGLRQAMSRAVRRVIAAEDTGDAPDAGTRGEGMP